MTEPRAPRVLLTSLALLFGASLGMAACGDEFVGGDARAPGGAGGAPSETNGGERFADGGAAPEGNGGASPSSAGAGGAAEAGAAGAEAAGSAGTPSTTPAYAADVLGDHPLVYWRMGDAREGVVADASGHGNDLVLQGAGHTLHEIGALADADDGAIGFDGASSFAIASDPRALDFTSQAPFSLECWARRSSGGQSYFQHLLSNVEGVANDRNGYALYLLPEPGSGESARSVFEYDRPAVDLGLWGDVVAEANWGHYVAVFDGAQALFYVNGTLADTEPVSGAFSARTGPFTVGRSTGTDSFFKGALDEIAVYPRALSAKIISRHYASGK